MGLALATDLQVRNRLSHFIFQIISNIYFFKHCKIWQFYWMVILYWVWCTLIHFDIFTCHLNSQFAKNVCIIWKCLDIVLYPFPIARLRLYGWRQQKRHQKDPIWLHWNISRNSNQQDPDLEKNDFSPVVMYMYIA